MTSPEEPTNPLLALLEEAYKYQRNLFVQTGVDDEARAKIVSQTVERYAQPIIDQLGDFFNVIAINESTQFAAEVTKRLDLLIGVEPALAAGLTEVSRAFDLSRKARVQAVAVSLSRGPLNILINRFEQQWRAEHDPESGGVLAGGLGDQEQAMASSDDTLMNELVIDPTAIAAVFARWMPRDIIVLRHFLNVSRREEFAWKVGSERVTRALFPSGVDIDGTTSVNDDPMIAALDWAARELGRGAADTR